MAVIRLENLAAGMVLNRDVTDRMGRVLLGAGAELTEKHLKIFHTWGIGEADIVGEQSDEEAPAAFAEDIDPVVLADAEAAVDSLFIHCDREHPAIRELRHLCILRKIAHAS